MLEMLNVWCDLNLTRTHIGLAFYKFVASFSLTWPVHIYQGQFLCVVGIRLKRSIASDKSWKWSTGQKNSVYAFGYNSAESEPIWMKSGALW